MTWLTEVTRGSLVRDEHGQPLVSSFRSAAVAARQIDELIGVVKGIVADGMVHQAEIEFLLRWLESNREAAEEWPAKVIYPRIAAALADGHVDSEEEKDLLDLLFATTGGNLTPQDAPGSNATALPYCSPAPSITFEHATFCFTGKFSSGSRDWCQNQVSARGGVALSSITKKLNYLVIGEVGSRDWLHSTHGTKILKAIEYRDQGVPISIVSEQHWHQCLG